MELPIIDLASRIGRAPAAVTKRTCIIVVDLETESGSQVLGLVVDGVHSVVDLQASDIEQAPSFGTRLRPDFINGMGKVDGRFIVLLELSAVLALPELSSLITTSAQEGLPAGSR